MKISYIFLKLIMSFTKFFLLLFRGGDLDFGCAETFFGSETSDSDDFDASYIATDSK